MAKTLYVSTTCPGCTTVKNLMAGKPIAGQVTLKYIDRDVAAERALLATGSRVVPTLVDERGVHTTLPAIRSALGV